MFCSKCGNQLGDAAAFCGKCGASSTGSAPGLSTPPPPSPVFSAPRPTSVSTGNAYSIVGIVMGAIAFFFFPIVLGPVGLILGAVGKSKGESKAVVAIVVSAAGLVIGMILGAMLATSY